MPTLESVDISCLRFTQSIALLIPVLVLEYLDDVVVYCAPGRQQSETRIHKLPTITMTAAGCHGGMAVQY